MELEKSNGGDASNEQRTLVSPRLPAIVRRGHEHLGGVVEDGGCTTVEMRSAVELRRRVYVGEGVGCCGRMVRHCGGRCC